MSLTCTRRSRPECSAHSNTKHLPLLTGFLINFLPSSAVIFGFVLYRHDFIAALPRILVSAFARLPRLSTASSPVCLMVTAKGTSPLIQRWQAIGIFSTSGSVSCAAAQAMVHLIPALMRHPTGTKARSHRSRRSRRGFCGLRPIPHSHIKSLHLKSFVPDFRQRDHRGEAKSVGPTLKLEPRT